jgi:hypothetical protein
MLTRASLLLAVIALFPLGCDHGLEPPGDIPAGAIAGSITYIGTWPPREQVRDLRFVAMRFVPQDTLDFLQLNRMAISNGLRYGVQSDTFTIRNVEPGAFLYSGVAQQVTSDLLSWRPVGLLDGDGGLYTVESGETTTVSLTVDFANPPLFPPQIPGTDAR